VRLLTFVLPFVVAACGSPPVDVAEDRAISLGAIPPKFVGQWAASKEWCFDKDGVNVLHIEEHKIVFQEAQSEGQLTITRVAPSEISVSMMLAGEGDRRKANHRFVLQDGGKALAESGYGPDPQNRYVKCTGKPASR
jgi:hypothetical protein